MPLRSVLLSCIFRCIITAGDAVWPMPALATVDPSGLACSCNLTIPGFAWSVACSVRLLRRRRARHFGGAFAKTRLWLSKNLLCKSGCLSRGRSNQLVLFASRTLTVEFASAVSPAPAVESGHRTVLNSPYPRPSLPSVGHTAFALRHLGVFFPSHTLERGSLAHCALLRCVLGSMDRLSR